MFQKTLATKKQTHSLVILLIYKIDSAPCNCKLKILDTWTETIVLKLRKQIHRAIVLAQAQRGKPQKGRSTFLEKLINYQLFATRS